MISSIFDTDKTISFFYFRKEGKFVSSGKDDADHLTVLNILLQNPEELQLNYNPFVIQENKIFILDMQEIPISSAEADNNSAYISKGSTKQWYRYNISGSRTAPRTKNGAWYVKVKEPKMCTRYIRESEVYELTHLYHTSKNNPDFSCTIATVRACNEHEPKPQYRYLVMYHWAGEDQGPEDFVVPCHGNTTLSTTNAYYCEDPKLLTEIDMLQKIDR